MRHGGRRRTSVALGCSVAVLVVGGCARSVDHSRTGHGAGTFAEGTPVSITPDLVSKAKAEGTVTVQYAAAADAMSGIIGAFKNAYPGIKVVLERKAGAPGGASMLQEYQAGEKRVDVFGGSDIPTALSLAGAGALRNFKPPEMNLYPKEYRVAPGLYATSADTIVTGINTGKVSTGDARALRDWSEVTKPKWKGHIGVTTPSVSTGGITQYYGWKHAGGDWLQRLAAQKPKLYDGTAPARDAVVSGQLSVLVGQLESAMLHLVHDGAPVGFVYPDATPEFPSNFYGVLTNAPHPNAAKLFWAWITSKKACVTEQSSPAYMRCPMTGVDAIPDLPTKAHWYAPIKHEWVPTDEDWQKGMPELQSQFSKVYGTP